MCSCRTLIYNKSYTISKGLGAQSQSSSGSNGDKDFGMQLTRNVLMSPRPIFCWQKQSLVRFSAKFKDSQKRDNLLCYGKVSRTKAFIVIVRIRRYGGPMAPPKNWLKWSFTSLINRLLTLTVALVNVKHPCQLACHSENGLNIFLANQNATCDLSYETPYDCKNYDVRHDRTSGVADYYPSSINYNDKFYNKVTYDASIVFTTLAA